MSAHQMVCHLADGFRMAMGTLAAGDASSPLRRTLVKWIALYAPVAWPDGIRTSPEIDQRVGAGTAPREFTSGAADLDGRPHPIFGRMSRSAWLRWGYLHVDHHLRQFGA